MNQKLSINPNLFIFGIPFIIILTSVFLALNLTSFSTDPRQLSIALTIDLVFLSPLAYFFLIRKRKIPKLTIMPFFIGGLVIATFLIPTAHQNTLNLIIKWFLPLVELTVITGIIINVRKIKKAYKINRSENLDFLTALKESTAAVLPQKFANVMTTEIGLFYFSFFTWKKRVYKSNEFTYHKENGLQAILGVILGVALIELFCVHLVLENSYPTLSWVLSIISIYGIIQIFGLIKSIPRTPNHLTTDKLILRMGIFQETQIPYEKIERIELTTADYPEDDKSYKKITLFDHNCIIHLKTEETLIGLFGIRKKYTHLVLSIDNKQGFKQSIEAFTSEV